MDTPTVYQRDPLLKGNPPIYSWINGNLWIGNDIIPWQFCRVRLVSTIPANAAGNPKEIKEALEIIFSSPAYCPILPNQSKPLIHYSIPESWFWFCEAEQAVELRRIFINAIGKRK